MQWQLLQDEKPSRTVKLYGLHESLTEIDASVLLSVRPAMCLSISLYNLTVQLEVILALGHSMFWCPVLKKNSLV